MNEVRTLLENFWICRDSDKETYYKVKRDIPNFQRFVRELLGWKLIHTENLLKLEKGRPVRKALWAFRSLRTSGITAFCV